MYLLASSLAAAFLDGLFEHPAPRHEGNVGQAPSRLLKKSSHFVRET
jgi:hypothetical protein